MCIDGDRGDAWRIEAIRRADCATKRKDITFVVRRGRQALRIKTELGEQGRIGLKMYPLGDLRLDIGQIGPMRSDKTIRNASRGQQRITYCRERIGRL